MQFRARSHISAPRPSLEPSVRILARGSISQAGQNRTRNGRDPEQPQLLDRPTSVSPNARETPKNPMPKPGNAAASTALPHPPKTSQDVPSKSAKQRLLRASVFISLTFAGYRPTPWTPVISHAIVIRLVRLHCLRVCPDRCSLLRSSTSRRAPVLLRLLTATILRLHCNLD